MTQKELQEKISDVIVNPYYSEDTRIAKAMQFINQHIKEVIGEKQKFTYIGSRTPEEMSDSGLLKTIIDARNELRKEQRKAAGL